MSTELEALDTPAVAVDLDRLERNLRQTSELASAAGVKLRPHIKTHKSAWIAKRQLELGACGITVAKLGEAEAMAAAGIADILIAYPIVGAAKLQRLAALTKVARITVGIDSFEAAAGLSALGQSLDVRIPLYLDVNSGLNRCGREPGAASAELGAKIAALPGVWLAGLMTHAGHVYGKASREECREIAQAEAQALLTTQACLRVYGVDVREISAGSTPTSKFAAELAGITEIRPGAYVFGDGSQLYPGIIGEEECAMRIYATVVSAPRPDTIIIDAGSKTLTTDTSPHRPGYGYLPNYPEAVIERLSEEHGIVRVPDDCPLRIGDTVAVIPNHCCTVTNLHDRLIGVRKGRIERMIQVDARGRTQ
ncbi:alanine racemase [Cohnella hashimotonis]|uniref:Alanine racemase n=1 Tax=Cohnella hashimotonis TaxID=2826895 RepID=A0ABT6TG70_9BACL|nr:alanine racemase [Cohnella hashimotonis]MDI4645821.1 alanine racemase [Cohnella hashimotonis]